MKTSVWFIVVISIAVGVFFVWSLETWERELWIGERLAVLQFDSIETALKKQKRITVERQAMILGKEGCVLLAYTDTDETCGANLEGSFAHCYKDLAYEDMRFEPYCLDFGSGHIDVPSEGVRAIYMTSQAFALPSFRNRLIAIAQETEINSIIIDIKEVDGYVMYDAGSEDIFPYQKPIMKDLSQVIEELHEQDIYVIGRIVLFKDKVWAENHPEHAVKRKDDQTVVWTDFGGKKYIDPGAQPFWQYLTALAGSMYEVGFDEINFDYIRFPSDGNMKNTYYPYSQERMDTLGYEQGRVAVLTEFMKYLSSTLRTKYPKIVLSADVFGMVTTNSDDLTIGQRLEPFLTNFDYVSPMVYPSHYPKGFLSLSGHPDNHPYEVVNHSQQVAQDRKKTLEHIIAQVVSLDSEIQAESASTTRKVLQDTQDLHKGTIQTLLGYVPNDFTTLKVGELRPWIQDFTCTWCAGYFPYGATEVREQIQATYDADQKGWMLWNAGNRYTTSALEKE